MRCCHLSRKIRRWTNRVCMGRRENKQVHVRGLPVGSPTMRPNSPWWGFLDACARCPGSCDREQRPVRGPKVCFHREGRPRIALVSSASGQSVFSRVSFVTSRFFTPKLVVVNCSRECTRDPKDIRERHSRWNLFNTFQRIQKRSLCLPVCQVSWGSRNAGEGESVRATGNFAFYDKFSDTLQLRLRMFNEWSILVIVDFIGTGRRVFFCHVEGRSFEKNQSWYKLVDVCTYMH